MKKNDWIFIPDSGIVKDTKWFPAYLDYNALDYHFWDKIIIRVYGEGFKVSFCKRNSEGLEKIHPLFNYNPREKWIIHEIVVRLICIGFFVLLLTSLSLLLL